MARLRDLPTVLRLAAVVLVGVALARPQSSRASDDLELEGIDIVIALDLSGSMQETDLVPNRLEAAKMVIQDFVRRRPSDRIGLVVFGREAYTHIPLTLDHGTFLRMLGELRLGIIDGNGTAIGNGIGVALNRLRKSDARSKVIIVLTDGENNAGNISPEQAARYAETLKVKIYTILAGDSERQAAGDGPPRQPEAARADRLDDRRHPLPRHRQARAAPSASRRSSRISRSRASTTAARSTPSSTAASCWSRSRCSSLEIALRLTRLQRIP